jgi:hypothetical protein
MIRWIVALTTLLLAGCVTTREVVYTDGYRDGYREYRYDDRYRDDYHRDERYGYAPRSDARGDYYYGQASYGYDYPSWYIDYPAYYSVFYPMYRSWYDPYWYPNYYYGVTYYPRNYFSIGFGNHWGSGWRYGWQYYSPYRYSWADNYYDWRPWRGYHDRWNRNHRPTPRYGSARNEAERLSRTSDWNRGHVARYDQGRRDDEGRREAINRYGASRGADYGSRAAPRQDPGVRGFGVRQPDDDVRRTGRYDAPRQAPATRGFGVPATRERGADYGNVDRDAMRYEQSAPSPARREAGRYGGVPERGYDDGGVALPRGGVPTRAYENRREPILRDASRPLPRSYDDGGATRWRTPDRDESYASPAPVARGYAPEPQRSVERRGRGYDAGPAPAYSVAEPRYSAPEPRYEAPAPRYEAPEPRRETREEPRFERSESRFDGGDRGGNRGGDEVRRVGGNRDD